MGKLQYCEILRTRINVTNMQETLDYIHSHREALRGKYICVSNVHTTVMAYENKKYRAIQNGAAMALRTVRRFQYIARGKDLRRHKG